MTKDPAHPNESATEHSEGPSEQADRPSGPVRQEQYQRTREQAAGGQDEVDRDARIRRRAHEIGEQEGRPEGLAAQHWDRAAQELEREVSKSRGRENDSAEPVTPNYGATAHSERNKRGK